MAYADLSDGLKNIIDYNHDYAMRAIFIIFFFVFALWYLFYYKKNIEKPTVFYSVMILRTMATGFSFFGLVLFPYLFYMAMQPAYAFSDFFTIYGLIYGAILILVMFVVMLDFTRWGVIVIAKMMGMDIHGEKYAKFRRWFRIYVGGK